MQAQCSNHSLQLTVTTGAFGLSTLLANAHLVGDVFKKDAELSLHRAEVMAEVWRSPR